MSFLNPIAFALLGLIPVIILLYLLKLKRKPLEISSTLLWFRAVEDLEANAPFQKLRKNLLLFLQLLILILLILALARPYLQSQSLVDQSFAVILDRSASMQAVDVAPSRFEVAREKVRELIGDLSEGDRMMLISAAGKARVLQSLTDNKEELLAALDSIEPVDTGTDLSEAFLLGQSLLQNQPGAELIILSDGAFPDLPPLAAKGVSARYIAIGKSGDNLALTALDVRPDPAVEGTFQLFTSVHNFSGESRTFDLELYVNDTIIDSEELEMDAGRQQAEVFRLSGVDQGAIRVRLDVQDALQIDNEASAVLTSDQMTDVLLVGGQNYFLERVFALDPRIRLSVTAVLQSSELEEYDLIVFNGECPAELSPETNMVFLGCAPDNWATRLAGPAVEVPPVVDYRRSHALFRYVDLERLAITRTLRLAPDPAAEILIDSVETPLGAISYHDGRRFTLFLPFTLEKTDWMLRASFPIFITNLIDFTREWSGAQAFSQNLTGRPAPIYLDSDSEENQLEIIAPDGKSYQVPVSGNPVYFASTQKAGIYAVQVGPEQSVQFAVNLLSSRESNIKPKTEIAMGSVVLEQSGQNLVTNREVWKSFAIGALLLLLVEWWVYHRRVGV